MIVVMIWTTMMMIWIMTVMGIVMITIRTTMMSVKRMLIMTILEMVIHDEWKRRGTMMVKWIMMTTSHTTMLKILVIRHW